LGCSDIHDKHVTEEGMSKNIFSGYTLDMTFSAIYLRTEYLSYKQGWPRARTMRGKTPL
jgi:hypothetical protein